jgi:hypothetical protein
MAWKVDMFRPFPPLDQFQEARFRIAADSRRQLTKIIFRRHPQQEWGTFFKFGFRRCSWGVAVSFIDCLPPARGDLDPLSPVVAFRSVYISRALRELETAPFGIGVIHSHPRECGVCPSSSDDDMDEYFSDLFASFGKDRPYCSLVMNRDSSGAIVFTGRVCDCGRWFAVKTVMSPDRSLLRLNSAQFRDAGVNPSGRNGHHLDRTDRLDRLLDSDGRVRLHGACIGVIGCGGTGSAAIEVLARANVRELVLVDFDRLESSNLERVHGSVYSDVGGNHPYKVSIMKRLVHEISPSTKVTGIVGNVLDPLAVDELLRCDVIVGASDTHHARAALSDLATHYLLPTIDVGVRLDGRDGSIRSQLVTVVVYSPETPCAFCSGCVENWWLTYELMPDEERERRKEDGVAATLRGDDPGLYWGGDAPLLPTVGYLTTMAGSLVAGYAINWIAGTSEIPHPRFQLDVGAPEFGFVSVSRSRRPHCSCVRTVGHAQQAECSITRPSHWPQAVVLEELPEYGERNPGGALSSSDPGGSITSLGVLGRWRRWWSGLRQQSPLNYKRDG